MSLHAGTYTRQSVLSSGTWYKIRVAESGVYCMSYEDLRNIGLSNPAGVRVYGYGGGELSQLFSEQIDDLPSVPIYMAKGADGVFGEGDYILFYAQGPVSWKYGADGYAHTRNTYSNYGYYFVCDDAGVQNILPTSLPYTPTPGCEAIRTYTQLSVVDNDLVNLVDPAGHDGGGRIWYGEKFTRSAAVRSFTFAMHHLTGEPVRVTCDFAAKSTENSSIRCAIGQSSASENIAGIPVSDNYTKANTAHISKTMLPVGTQQQTITLSYSTMSETATGYLNYIEIAAPAVLHMEGAWMPIQVHHNTEARRLYKLSGAGPDVQLWDIQRLDSVRLVPTSQAGDTLYWESTSAQGTWVAVRTGSVSGMTPEAVGRIGCQNLHQYDNKDYVIITPENMYEASRVLAAAHDAEGLTTLVVTDQQVYNEFSSGTPDATAYRKLMKMLYDRAEGSILPPQYLLLMGDGSFDNRGILSFSGNHNLLTYQDYNSTHEINAYSSDDYFGHLQDGSGLNTAKDKMCIGVGRLPVSTPEEAYAVVNKTIQYMQSASKGKWKQQIAVLADDGDSGLHIDVAEAGAEPMRKANPSFVVNKIYLDAFVQESSASGERYPMAQQKLSHLFDSGILFFDYSGHGGYNSITSEGIMNIASIRAMTNKNLGFWMMATCNFGHFDAKETCAAEHAVLNTDGGAIAVLAADRTVYAHLNDVINQQICTRLFEHDSPCGYSNTLGHATMEAKNNAGSNINKLTYILLGDPAVSIPFPTQYEVKVSAAPDTIRALSVDTIYGYIADENGDADSTFNGELYVTVYDKLQQITTLDNDHDGSTRTYNDYPNRLFSGKTQVKDGQWQFTFMTPKDIRYNYGEGRMVFYAYDSNRSVEGTGHYEDFLIGGSSTKEYMHSTGPDMEIWLNYSQSPMEWYSGGGKTHPHPHFYARLWDEYGINTVGSGIGHDLLLTIDSDPQQTYVLNDYFENNEGGYQGGDVSYPMLEQAEGMHTLRFRAWDLLNNSSSAMLSYEVVQSLEPQLYRVYTYPNPVAQGEVFTMCVDHDRPDDVAKTEVLFYNTSGQLIHQYSQRGYEPISLSPQSIGLACGIYIYKVIVTESTGETSASMGGKMIVR